MSVRAHGQLQVLSDQGPARGHHAESGHPGPVHGRGCVDDALRIEKRVFRGGGGVMPGLGAKGAVFTAAAGLGADNGAQRSGVADPGLAHGHGGLAKDGEVRAGKPGQGVKQPVTGGIGQEPAGKEGAAHFRREVLDG